MQQRPATTVIKFAEIPMDYKMEDLLKKLEDTHKYAEEALGNFHNEIGIRRDLVFFRSTALFA